MSHHTVDWIDSRLTAEITPSCTLWVVVGSESALYTAVNGQGEILATVHRDYLEVVDAPFWRIGPHAQRMLESSLVWHLPFGQRQGFLFHPNVTLVPRRLFRHGDLSGYFRLLLEPDNYIYTSEELPFWDAYLVAATDGAHARFFQNLFPGARIRHSAAACSSAHVPWLRTKSILYWPTSAIASFKLSCSSAIALSSTILFPSLTLATCCTTFYLLITNFD